MDERSGPKAALLTDPARLDRHDSTSTGAHLVASTRTLTIDLDDADSIARGWAAAERVLTIRAVDPELRRDVVRLLPLLDDETRAEIERLIDEVPPLTILREPSLFEALVAANHRGHGPGCMACPEASRSPIGALPRPEPPKIDTAADYRRDPARYLWSVVALAVRVTSNRRRVVESCLAVATAVGIDHEAAERIVLESLRARSKAAA